MSLLTNTNLLHSRPQYTPEHVRSIAQRSRYPDWPRLCHICPGHPHQDSRRPKRPGPDRQPKYFWPCLTVLPPPGPGKCQLGQRVQGHQVWRAIWGSLKVDLDLGFALAGELGKGRRLGPAMQGGAPHLADVVCLLLGFLGLRLYTGYPLMSSGKAIISTWVEYKIKSPVTPDWCGL